MSFYERYGGGWRLLAGLLAGATVGSVMGQGVELVGYPVSMMAAISSVLIGVGSAMFLRSNTPRRERPSTPGSAALMILLASYIVIGRLVWSSLGGVEFAYYAASGVVIVWLVFTAVAESPLLYAFGMGGLLGALCGVFVPVLLPGPFDPLFSLLTQSSERWMVYANLGLLCAFSGAFSAVAARLSGFGLAESRHDSVWRFDQEGRLDKEIF